MPRVKNTEKKYAAESDNYIFCWGIVEDKRVALMLTDNEYKRALKRADKNKEDFPSPTTLLGKLFRWLRQ
ncbi:MAG: hypothetical protein H8E55_13505 [Pelagibacterales bacterium]|nr:hypothetical protein [Pelagibacterales bacterium]